ITAGVERPQCIICMKVLSNASLKPNTLQCHLNIKHPQFKSRDVFEKAGVKKCQLDVDGSYQQQKLAAIEASYIVALKTVKAKKAHIIAHNLVPCTKETANLLVGTNALKKLQRLSMSNNAIKRSITNMSNDIKSQVIEEIKNSPRGLFSMQLDETTDVCNLAQLMVYVWDIKNEYEKEEYLFCKPQTTTAAQDVFTILNIFFEEHSIEWKNLCSICTDGAPAMLGCKSGFQTLVKNISLKVTRTHCFIHRQILATKTLLIFLNQVLNEIIKAVHFIKSSILRTHIFKNLCLELGSLHEVLLFHTEVRWLSKGKVLNRVFEKQNELKTFFVLQNKTEFEYLFTENKNLYKIVYLVDSFGLLNDLNVSLQGPNSTLEKIKSFRMKLQLWSSKIDIKKYVSNPRNLSKYKLHINNDLRLSIQENLRHLSDELLRYFPDTDEKLFALATNPFSMDVCVVPQGTQEQFIDMMNSNDIKTEFSTMPNNPFWIRCRVDYPLSEIVLRILLPFSKTFLCESGFSHLLTIIEIKALTTTIPRIQQLAKQRQAQPSH
uniref:Uncharacterized protein n=1 Tax=Pelodiscus sinensis TaxID=13735 RepID=K7FGQ0_PELSI